MAGFYLLFLASAVNIIVIIGLLIYGLNKKEYFKDCKKAILIMLINIPIAFIYACIGLSIL